MKAIFTKGLIFLVASMLLLSGCSQTLAEESSAVEETESETTVSDVRSEADDFFKDMVFPQLAPPTEDMPVLTLNTSMGDIKLVLYPDQAPLAVENFITHAKNGYYDGVTFHRVINDFMIQTGDPKGDGTGGESIWGDPFDNEELKGVWSFRGALAMANSGPDTNGSQFYIVQNPKVDATFSTERFLAMGYPQPVIDYYLENGGVPHLDMGYTSFGQVLEGMDVVDAIAKVESDPSTNKPNTPVTINSITIEKDWVKK